MGDVGAHNVDLWRVTYAPGVAVGTPIQTADAVCPMPAGYGTCTRKTSMAAENNANAGPNDTPPGPGKKALHSTNTDDSSGPDVVGTQTCYIARVQNPTSDAGDNTVWRNSGPVCAIAGITPKIQVWGGDVKASGAIQTTTTPITVGQNRLYGSWGEYGVFSGGANFEMASGAATANVPSNTGRQSLNFLTFANVSSPTTFGEFSDNLATPMAIPPGAIIRNGDLPVNSLDNLIAQLMPGPGNDINSLVTNGDARKTFVINGRLTINGNLTYPGSVSTIRNIPGITIIATEVVVGGGVTSIDPSIQAVRLSTCGDVHSGTNYFQSLRTLNLLNSGVCGNKLQFNGAVVADKLYLYRTFDNVNGEPAETFNLRASNILSSYVGRGPAKPIATTNSVSETPPRF